MKLFTLLALGSSLALGSGVHIQGNYVVPVPPALAAFSVFPTRYGIKELSDGKKAIYYHLPEDVVGPYQQEIELTQTALNSKEFSGNGNNASCLELSSSGRMCAVQYGGLSYKLDDVMELLEKKYAGDPNLEQRKEVARLFSNEPGGVIRYDLTRTPYN